MVRPQQRAPVNDPKLSRVDDVRPKEEHRCSSKPVIAGLRIKHETGLRRAKI
jgi:hypothetical protein